MTRLEIEMGYCFFKYESICIAALKMFSHWKHIASINYYDPKNPEISTGVANKYITFLRKYGFLSHWSWDYRRWSAYSHDVNITKWFADVTVFRYLEERSVLVNTWYEKVYHQGRDPWWTFVTLHTYVEPMYGLYGTGHALLPRKIVALNDPRKVNESLNKPTGFDFMAIESLHGHYSGSEDVFWSSNPTIVSFDQSYEDILKRVNESSPPAASTVVPNEAVAAQA